MTIGITSLGSNQDTANDADIVLSGLSPAANSLIWIYASNFDNASNAVSSVTDTFTGTGSWTIESGSAFEISVSGPTRFLRGTWAWAIAGSSPGSGAITVNWVAATRDKTIHAVYFTGYDSGATIPDDQNNNTGTASTLNVALGGSVQSTSLVITACSSRNGSGLAVDGAFTLITTEQNTGDFASVMAYDDGGADQDADWSNLGTVQNGALIAEIVEAAAVDTFPSLPDYIREQNQNPVYRMRDRRLPSGLSVATFEVNRRYFR